MQAALLSLLVLLASGAQGASVERQVRLLDESRQRPIPVLVFEPMPEACSQGCPVVVFGSGYQAAVADYSFLLRALAEAGYLAIAVQLDLAGDAPMPNTGNVIRDRASYWARGAMSVEYTVKNLASDYSQHDWSRVILAGHSQGGDIAALLASKRSFPVHALLTLDNRRVPLPPVGQMPTLSFRSADQAPDSEVLPEVGIADEDKTCIVRLPSTRHDDMNDNADPITKRLVIEFTLRFLTRGQCQGDKVNQSQSPQR